MKTATAIDLEGAIYRAAAMIDLLTTKLICEDRAGRVEYNEPHWVGNIASLSREVGDNLGKQFYANHDEVRSILRSCLKRCAAEEPTDGRS